jgi:2-polyprenyl-6-hydroxyphenyl methylase/3-demethylubiquinone-9 3-methyltransferase
LGTRSRRWRIIKHTYNRIPKALRPLFTAVAIAPQELKNVARALAAGRPGSYLQSWTEYNKRGMNRWRDAVDWVGGYPYEVATPEAVFDFCRAHGFELTAMRCGGVGLGCNEFVFVRHGR